MTEPELEARAYVLNLLQEEAAEVIQAASKILRFGDIYAEGLPSNVENLRIELTDVTTVLVILSRLGIEFHMPSDEFHAKMSRIYHYVGVSNERGHLSDAATDILVKVLR